MASVTADLTIKDVLLADTLDLEWLYYLDSVVLSHENGKKELEGIIPSLDSKPDSAVRQSAAWFALGNFDKALEAAKNDTKHPFCQFIIGLDHEYHGHEEEAFKCFQRAAQAAPTSAPFALKPIDALRRLGRLDEAMAMAKNQQKQFSDKPELDFYLGRIYEDNGEYQEALDHYCKSIDINPNYPECLFRAAYLADLRGLDALAKDYYTRIGPESPRSYLNACLNLALLYEDDEEYDKSVQCCRRALKISPNNKRAKLYLSNAESAVNMYYSPEETKQSEKMEAILRVPVSDFELSVRSRNCLASMNILNLGDLIKRTEAEMLAYKNFGETSLREIKDMLSAKGLRLGMMREDAATRQGIERQRKNTSSEILSKSVDELNLGVRARKCMETMGIATIGELVSKTEAELEAARNFGRVSLTEIKKKLSELGLSFKDE